MIIKTHNNDNKATLISKSSFFKRVKIKIKKINDVIAVISSYSIFFGLILFLIGTVIRLNIVEDDLFINDSTFPV